MIFAAVRRQQKSRMLFELAASTIRGEGQLPLGGKLSGEASGMVGLQDKLFGMGENNGVTLSWKCVGVGTNLNEGGIQTPSLVRGNPQQDL